MGYLKRLTARRLRTGLVVVTLCLSASAVSGCVFGYDHIIRNSSGSSLRLGEWGSNPYGTYPDDYMAVFYQTASGRENNFNSSEALLDLYYSYKERFPNPYDAAFVLLHNLRISHCDHLFQTERDVCERATAYSERKEFLEESLVPYRDNRSRCIAYGFTIPQHIAHPIVSRWGTVSNGYHLSNDTASCRPE